MCVGGPAHRVFEAGADCESSFDLTRGEFGRGTARAPCPTDILNADPAATTSPRSDHGLALKESHASTGDCGSAAAAAAAASAACTASVSSLRGGDDRHSDASAMEGAATAAGSCAGGY